MRVRRIAMACALVLMVVLFTLVVWQRAGNSVPADSRGVQLRNGETVNGVLLQLQESSYLLQMDRGCLILSPDEIRQVDGRTPSASGIRVSDRVERSQETFEDVKPGGEIELHSIIRRMNGGSAVLSSLNWGMAAHELGQLEHYRVVDEFGNELPVRVEDHPTVKGGKLASVVLKRPVLPGEEMKLTTVIGDWGKASRDGDVWVYRIAGDYPDNRLVTRSVLLPAGAEILAVRPEPLHTVPVDGRQLVIWRRYFLQGETIPWEIRYKM